MSGNLVPITREFLKNFYNQFEITPLSQEIQDQSEEITKILESNFQIDFPADDNNPKDNFSTSLKPLKPKILYKAPHKLDENVWRMREQCEEILELLKATNLNDIRKKIEDSSKQNWIDTLENLKGQVDTSFDFIIKYQTDTMKRIEELIQTFLPQDFRASLLKYKREATESANKKQLDELIARGGSISEKYNLYWTQQMARRESLAQVGNATGAYKFVIKYLGGVPEVLLEFIKKINEKDGPMEELRLKYGGTMYFLTVFLNRIQLLIGAMLFAGEESKWENFDTYAKLLADGILNYQQALKAYLDEMVHIMEKSPFFITKDEADTLTQRPTEVVVKKEHKVQLQVTKGSTVNWDFTTKAKDIGFAASFTSIEGKSIELQPSTKVNSHLTAVKHTVKVEESGTVELFWDNSYSYFSSKTLLYRAWTVEDIPVEEEEEGVQEGEETEEKTTS